MSARTPEAILVEQWDKLLAERNDLLAALRQIADLKRRPFESPFEWQARTRDIADAALAKVQS